ncbi:hypothetical protein GCM10023067_22530 [Aminobacter aganoensis]
MQELTPRPTIVSVVASSRARWREVRRDGSAGLAARESAAMRRLLSLEGVSLDRKGKGKISAAIHGCGGIAARAYWQKVPPLRRGARSKWKCSA